jgi:hypothetical protein
MKLRRRADQTPTGYVGDHADKLSRIPRLPHDDDEHRRREDRDRPSSPGHRCRCHASSGAAGSGRAARPLTVGRVASLKHGSRRLACCSSTNGRPARSLSPGRTPPPRPTESRRSGGVSRPKVTRGRIRRTNAKRTRFGLAAPRRGGTRASYRSTLGRATGAASVLGHPRLEGRHRGRMRRRSCRRSSSFGRVIRLSPPW